MLNTAPIFMNGFSFGGTNLLMNLIASHPDVTMLSGETHEIFFSKPNNSLLDKALRRFVYLPVRILTGQHLFGKWCFDERKEMPTALMRYVDLIFYIDKITTSRNEYKYEGVRYSQAEIRQSRFITKNMNGVVFASKRLSEIYPDATFLSLVRNGLPLCEGYVRRGWKAEDVGRMYQTVCQKMIEDEKTIPRYHIVRFEDMIADPLAFMKQIYVFADLDLDSVPKVRLQAKRSMNKDGTRKYTFGGVKDRDIHWFDILDIDNFVRKDVNENQAGQLSPQDVTAFLQAARTSLEHFGYQ